MIVADYNVFKTILYDLNYSSVEYCTRSSIHIYVDSPKQTPPAVAVTKSLLAVTTIIYPLHLHTRVFDIFFIFTRHEFPQCIIRNQSDRTVPVFNLFSITNIPHV